MNKVLFLADAHLPQDSGAVDEFIDYVDRRLANVTGLYLLGDLFEIFVGLPPFRNEACERLIAFLDGLADRGIEAAYVGGNREYFLEERLTSTRIRATERTLVLDCFGKTLWLNHGDTLNVRDKQYLRWRRISRSLPVRTFCAALPMKLARRIESGLSRRLAETNQAYRANLPEKECLDFGRRAAAAGADMVLIGHFHEPKTLEVSPAPVLLHILPDWLSRRTHAELHEDGRFVLEAD